VNTRYEIRNASGRLVAYHVRRDTADGKKVWWQQPDGSTGLNGTRLEELPLYGADLVSDAGADEIIVVCEGEKARDALEGVKIPAVGTVTGAAATPGPKALEVLRDRRVCLWPDNDDAGRAHMERIGQRLHGLAAEVLIFTWHDAEEEGADAADHHAVKSGNPKTIDRLFTDLEASPLFEAGPEVETGTFTAGDLMAQELPEPSWIVPDILAEGVAILAGKPKLGKSWMALGLCVAVASGGYALGTNPVE
jgi:AAA domain